jgi:hypothetical protein
MSIRPDVLPPAVLGELAKLQDKVCLFVQCACACVRVLGRGHLFFLPPFL